MKAPLLIFFFLAQAFLVVAQKNETKQQLDNIEVKIDSILKIINTNNGIDSLSPVQIPTSVNNDSLVKVNTDLQFKADSLKTLLSKKQSSLDSLSQKVSADLNWQKKMVEQDIVSVINQTTVISLDLLQNIQTRAKEYKAGNLSDIEEFIEIYEKIKTANNLLKAQYNLGTNNVTISQLNKLVIDKKKFPGLYESKIEVLFLLENYCKSYKDVLELIDAAQTFPDETERKKILQEKTYEYENYPFLIQSLEQAKANKNFVLSPVTSCQ